MRNTIGLALAAILCVGVADVAFAGKPKGGDEAGEGAKKDPYAIPEMKITKIADFDSLFDRSKSPLESMVLARKRLDMSKAKFNLSLGLAEDFTFEGAVEEFKKKMEGKVKVALKKGTMPKLTTADAIPDDLQGSWDAFNACIDEFEKSYNELGTIKGELATLADEASKLDPAAAAQSAGLNPLDTAAATKNTATNVKTLSTGKEESQKLYASIEGVPATLEAAFGPAQD